MAGLMQGKRGLVMGVANERSIAWGIAKALADEGAELAFTDAGIRRMAEIAWQVNEKMENIGARRLHTVMEKLLEELSFAARSEQVAIDDAYVDSKLASLAQREDLARYVV